VRVVFVSGPPRCGKDAAGLIIAKEGAHPMALDKFAIELKERCHSAYRLMTHRAMPLPWGYFEEQKDVPLAAFEGLSPRQAYVEFFQKWVGPVCGRDALGRWLVKRVKHFAEIMRKNGQVVPGIIITDAGRREDCLPVVSEWGALNMVQVRLSREGCTFEGDSREDFDLRNVGVRTEKVVNPGDTLAGLSNALRAAFPGLFHKILTP